MVGRRGADRHPDERAVRGLGDEGGGLGRIGRVGRGALPPQVVVVLDRVLEPAAEGVGIARQRPQAQGLERLPLLGADSPDLHRASLRTDLDVEAALNA